MYVSLDFFVDGRSRYLYIVLGGCVFNLVAHYRYLLPTVYLSVADNILVFSLASILVKTTVVIHLCLDLT